MNQTPSGAKAVPFQLLQLTDFHLLADASKTMMGINTDETFRDVLKLALRHDPRPDALLLTGDIAQDPSAATYERLSRYLSETQIPCYYVPGNHDQAQTMMTSLTAPNISTTASARLGSWQLINLDSTLSDSATGHLSPNQLNLLESQLAAAPEIPTLVALHHSPVATGSSWLDTMRLDNSDEFFAIINRHTQVKAIVYGHIHQQFETWRHSIEIMACPSTCFQFKPESSEFALDSVAPGFRRLWLYPDGSIKTAVIRLPEIPAGLEMSSGGY